MSILACAVCSVEFVPKSKKAKYCSTPCKNRGKPSASGLTCYICSGAMMRSSTSKPQGEAAHNACRKTLPPVKREKACIDCSVLFFGKSSRCNPCRFIWAKANAKSSCLHCDNPAIAKSLCATHYSNVQREKHGRVYPDGKKKPPPRTCAICDEPVTRVYESSSVAMHKECRLANPGKARRLNNGRVSLKRRMAEARAAKASAGTSGGGRVFIVGGCSWCGKYVTALGRYCSKKCKEQVAFNRKSSGFSFKVSPRKRLEIYERDKWTCQLCMNAVDPNAAHRSDGYPTLDHIIPQSAMLIPDHSESNLRLAHLWCNSARGDGSNMSLEEFQRRVSEKFGEMDLAA